MLIDRLAPRADLSPFLQAAETLGSRFTETARHHDETGTFPFANFDALFEAGLLGLVTPAHRGGLGGGLAEANAVVSSVARGEPSTALVLAMHYCQHYMAGAGEMWPAHLAEKVAGANRTGVALLNAAQVEPGSGSPSHGALPQTVARRDGNRWRITGRKLYTTGIPILRWVSLLAVTDEAEPRLASFLVPTEAPGIRVEETWAALGLRATNSHDFVLEDVPVPDENLIEAHLASEGLKRDPRMLAWYMLLVGSVYHGVARAAGDWILDFASRTIPGSLGASLATVPRFQDGIGQIELLLATSRRMLLSTAADFDAGREIGLDAVSAKHVAIENAIAVTTLALDLGGNPGLSRANPLERHHRDALAGKAHAPQNNLIRGMLFRQVLGAHLEARPAS